MIPRTLVFLASVALAAAAPQRGGPGRGHGGPGRPHGPPCKPTVPADTEITLPKNNGEKELASPDGLVLKHVVLGHGYQNYTCASDLSSTATGALAVLYDVSPFYPGNPKGVRSYNDWLAIAQTASYTLEAPLQLDAASTLTTVAGSEPMVNVAAPFFSPDTPVKIAGVGTAQPVGVHYFDGSKVPTFDFGTDLFKATKLDAIPAPTGATPGQKGEAAVSWLYLGDGGGSVGIDFVYRVNTVGGSGHTCDVEGSDSTEYTAFYYMYAKP